MYAVRGFLGGLEDRKIGVIISEVRIQIAHRIGLAGRPSGQICVWGASQLCVDRSRNAAIDDQWSDLRAYVEQPLVTTLCPGDSVVMDNLSAHKVAGVRKAIEAMGARLVYLPSCSPDLNPIELATRQTKDVCR